MTQDFLLENLRGMCAFRDPDRRECCEQPARTIRDYCTPCLAADRLSALPASASPHAKGEHKPNGVYLNPVQLEQVMNALEGWDGKDTTADEASRKAAFEMIQDICQSARPASLEEPQQPKT